MRYTSKMNYGRYEIIDTSNDHRICYCEMSEDCIRIVNAMNEQYEKDQLQKRYA